MCRIDIEALTKDITSFLNCNYHVDKVDYDENENKFYISFHNGQYLPLAEFSNVNRMVYYAFYLPYQLRWKVASVIRGGK